MASLAARIQVTSALRDADPGAGPWTFHTAAYDLWPTMVEQLAEWQNLAAELVASLEVCTVAGPRPDLGRLTDEKRAACERYRRMMDRHLGIGG